MCQAALQLIRSRAFEYRQDEARLRRGHVSQWESASILGGVAKVLERLANDVEALDHE